MNREQMELTNEGNRGNMSKAEVVDFFADVIDDLGIVLALEFTPTSPSIYLEKTPKILFCENDLNGYKWQVKERVLHEIAHHFEKGKRKHGVNFYEPYIKLLTKYMVGSKCLSHLHGEELREKIATELVEAYKQGIDAENERSYFSSVETRNNHFKGVAESLFPLKEEVKK